MDAVVKNLSLGAGPDVERPSLQEAEDAVRHIDRLGGR